MKKTLLWLDDLRNPSDYIDINQYNVYWVYSFEEFVKFFENENFMPDIIWFDHDLGENENRKILPNGYDCAKWLIEWCEKTGTPICSEYHSQSQNPVGKRNIVELIYNYERFKKRENNEARR